MKQTAVRFAKYCLGDDSVCKQLNDYLAEHPGHEVALMDYEKEPHSCTEKLFVVFNLPANPQPNVNALSVLTDVVRAIVLSGAIEGSMRDTLMTQLNYIREALNHG